MSWCWPLPSRPQTRLVLPAEGGPGAFGACRRYDTHTGVDLYCTEGDPAYAVEDGTVVVVELFTGPDAGSPWWLPTWAVLVEGRTGVVVYGEVTEPTGIFEGLRVRAGDMLGRVTRVLALGKKPPHTMLHLELYTPGTRTTEWWREHRPPNLLDPTPYLEEARLAGLHD